MVVFLLLQIVVNGMVYLLVNYGEKTLLASIILIGNCINRDYSTVNYHK